MKTQYCIIFLILFSLFASCKDDDETKYPSSDSPEIVVVRDELYATPNRHFVIKAKLKDDLGLKSLQIKIAALHLDKVIYFPTDSLIKEYDLSYEFLAPADKTPVDIFDVDLTLNDVSNNETSKKLTLKLDGDFDAPAISNMKPIDKSVIFAVDNMTLSVSFDLSDATGIDSLLVFAAELNIDEKIKVEGAKTYSFAKTYNIPSELKEYAITITTQDNFVEPNRLTHRTTFSIADGLTAMYLADVPKNTDLEADIFGVPMYYHKKDNGVFTFRYYADKDMKEIYLLGQESSFEPHCFGLSDAGTLENSIDAKPIVLPERGYYTIEVNPSALSYTAIAYTPASTVYDPANITICGNGMEKGGWNPNNTDLLLSANTYNPYRLERTLTLTGLDVAITVTSPGWASPWWRVDANGIVVFTGGANASYKGIAGNYKFTLDSELQRAVLAKE